MVAAAGVGQILVQVAVIQVLVWWWAFVGDAAVLMPSSTSSAVEEHPELIANQVNEAIYNPNHNSSSSWLSSTTSPCKTGNPIDDCWRCDPNWSTHRHHLADCAIGFGRNAHGGKNGQIYTVTTPDDNDPLNPQPGTLRHAAIQSQPLWIIFSHSMTIKLKLELLISSHKTIDGRGADVHIAGGPCIAIVDVTNVIIHGISIHDCKQGVDRYSTSRPYAYRSVSDGDGISIQGGRHVWIDHCSLWKCYDGLIDAIRGSTGITISNNRMTRHNKVMLLGHSDGFVGDKGMQVTIAFNHFGKGLVQRMPRCRHGYFHVVNNDYTHWEMYAIGGSAEPTILSQGNRFLASDNQSTKEVTKREGSPKSVWKKWNWRSQGDLMLNGAYFTQSGNKRSSTYAQANSLDAKPSSRVPFITNGAGAIRCRKGSPC